jgi:hypothetical protein
MKVKSRKTVTLGSVALGMVVGSVLGESLCVKPDRMLENVCMNVVVMKVKSPKVMLGSVSLKEHGSVQDVLVKPVQMSGSVCRNVLAMKVKSPKVMLGHAIQMLVFGHARRELLVKMVLIKGNVWMRVLVMKMTSHHLGMGGCVQLRVIGNVGN